MTLVEGAQGGNKACMETGGTLPLQPIDQVSGSFEYNHFLRFLSVKPGFNAEFTIKIVPLQTILFRLS